ncbi:MAG: PilZ protein [Devosia sp.]|uniref:PilZ domain-containing protein n=1 Tax=Devosia sp. TaxID=1871048 RepID=UPI0026164177|nr:PilZ domain-containing protein [Devosia sp.]MDB5542373.1 PilZ protein [Devosia sp.]
MASSFDGDRSTQRIRERRSELRYDGGLAASFTHTPREGTGVRVVRCRVESLSPSAMVISAPIHGDVGEHMWVELDGFGPVRCEIEQVRDDGFVCFTLINDEARRRLGIWVSWLRRRGGRLAGDQREHMRARPVDTRTTITLTTGETLTAHLSNVSRSGAAVSTDCTVAIGDAVSVGKVPAHVVRMSETGFAVAFDFVLEAADADRLVAGYEVVLLASSKAG